jgi:hypothetical protein
MLKQASVVVSNDLVAAGAKSLDEGGDECVGCHSNLTHCPRGGSCGASVAANVKHQRARAEVSRVKDELSLRALRCMR